MTPAGSLPVGTLASREVIRPKYPFHLARLRHAGERAAGVPEQDERVRREKAVTLRAPRDRESTESRM